MERKQGSALSENDKDDFDVIYQDHLGGCALKGDGATYYPVMWKHMIEKYNIKSMIDIGCGRAYSADYFKGSGVLSHGVEGCKEAVEKSFLESDEVTLHDYENDGPYVPEMVYDLGWSCEFVEHVTQENMQNFIETFKRCKIVAVTYAIPGQGGHHHVNEQYEPYWIDHMSRNGFVLDMGGTEELRELAKQDGQKYSPLYLSHFIRRGLLFVNKDFVEAA